MPNDDPRTLEQWLDQSIADLQAGRTDAADVRQQLGALSEQADGTDADIAALVAAIDGLADELLDDDASTSDLIEVLRRARDGGGSALRLLGLDVEALEETDELSTRYRLHDELGKGGMGEVRRAFDRRIRREVALKRLKAGPTTELMIGRFLQEAQVTGQLEHPHIVPVYDIGVGPQASVFFTMKRVQGEPLDVLVKAGRFSRLERLDIFKKVCDAVAYAHARGVVHRDLKPANIMVGTFGQVFVLDWGLAKLTGGPDLTDDPSSDGVRSDRELLDIERTGFDQIMGTPAYMAPEQAEGDHDAVDHRADVYGLGSVLYVLLTGRRAFEGRAGLLQRVRSGQFPAPHTVARVPRALSAVVCKAMARDPDQRYPDATALRADVEAWQEGREVTAHRYTLVHRVRRTARRHGAWVLGVTGALGVLAAGTLTVLVLYTLSLGLALDRANDARTEAASALADADLAMAVVQAEQGRFEQARARLHSARAANAELGRDDDAGRFTQAWLAPRLTEPAWRLEGDRFRIVALADDGRRAVAWSMPDHSHPNAASLIVELALPSGRVLGTNAVGNQRVVGVGYSPDGPAVAVYEGDRVRVQTFAGDELVALGPHVEFSGSGVTLDPDGIVVSQMSGSWWYGWDGTLRGGPWPARQRHGGAVRGNVRRMERLPVRSLADYGLFDLSAGRFVRVGSPELHPLDDGAMVAIEGGQVVATEPDGAVRWTYDLQQVDHLTVGGGRVLGHRDGRRLHVFDETGVLIAEQNLVAGPSASQGATYLLSDGSAVVTVAEGAVAFTWLREGPLGGGTHTREAASELALSDDGWLAALTHRDPHGVEVRERTTGAVLQRWATEQPCLDLEVVGPTVWAACRDGGLLAFPLAGGEPEVLFDGYVRHVAELDGVAYVVTETHLARLGPDGVAAQVPIDGRTWDLVARHGRIAVSSRDHDQPAALLFTADLAPVPTDLPTDAGYTVALLPDGGMVTSSQRGRVRRVGPSGRQELLPVDHSETVMAVAADAAGRMLAVGRYDGSLELFDLHAERSLGILPSAPRAIVDLAWTTDGPVLLHGNGILETLAPDRPWPAPVSFVVGDGAPPFAGVSARHLAEAAIAAGRWSAVGALADEDDTLLGELPASDAVRAAVVAGDGAALDAALARAVDLDEATVTALRAAVKRPD